MARAPRAGGPSPDECCERADDEHRRDDEQLHQRTHAFGNVRENFHCCRGQRKCRSSQLRDATAPHSGVVRHHAHHAHAGSIPGRRACAIAIELLDQELAHFLVGQPRHHVANRFGRERLRQAGAGDSAGLSVEAANDRGPSAGEQRNDDDA